MQRSPSKTVITNYKVSMTENDNLLDKKNKSELLYLIAKLLDSLGPEFQNTTQSLCEDLVRFDIFMY